MAHLSRLEVDLFFGLYILLIYCWSLRERACRCYFFVALDNGQSLIREHAPRRPLRNFAALYF